MRISGPNKPFIIHESSMDPVFKKGDRVLAQPIKGSEKLARGDMVFFKVNGFKDQLIKRVIGLPGEKLEIMNGKVLINGAPLSDYIQHIPASSNFGPVDIPAESYFLMGDNRNVSEDSRHYGPVPISSITHKASKIFRPSDNQIRNLI